MPNDAKLGMLAGVAGVVLAAVLSANRPDPPAAPPPDPPAPAESPAAPPTPVALPSAPVARTKPDPVATPAARPRTDDLDP
ncbi:MAG: hypothetical protein C0501_20620 [Isosphaera sp.]|nr:hypothetical protein [Isosphaera sp.]